MIFPMHVGERVCPWSLFHCQGNFSVFCSFIRMLQLEETLLCKQCAECVVCLWLCCVAAVPNVHNLCVFIPPIVSRFWLFVAPICDLWRWMERSTMILQRHLVSFFCFFLMRNLSGCYPEQFGLLHWQPKVGGESDTQFNFSMLSWSYFVFCFILRSSDVWISSSRSVVSIPDLQQLHCFRLSGTHAFDGEYIFFQILSHGGLPGRSMILERDEGSDGWIAFEGIYDSVKYEFDRLRVCFKCPDVGALDDGSFQGWFVNRAADGAEPDWGTATMRCLSHWEREWSVLLFFFLLVNVFSVIVKAYDLKLFVDAMIPFFVSQVSDREQSVIWNETTLPIMLQRECIC